MQSVVATLQTNDYVKSVTPITNNGVTVGYTITFANSGDVKIYNGENGKDAPVIGVKQDTDGIWYWTLAGEWLTDDKNNKLPVSGVTPQLMIEDDYWYISYDGKNWEKLDKSRGDSMFESVVENDDAVVLTLADGSVITLPKQKKFSIKLGCDSVIDQGATLNGEMSHTFEIPFTVEGATGDFQILYNVHELYYTHYISVKVKMEDANNGVVTVKLPHERYYDGTDWYLEYPQVNLDIIAIDEDGRMTSESVIFTYEEFYMSIGFVEKDGEYVFGYDVSPEGEEIEITMYLSGYYYEADGTFVSLEEPSPLSFDDLFYLSLDSPYATSNWLTYLKTKVSAEYTMNFRAGINYTGKERTAKYRINKYFMKTEHGAGASIVGYLYFSQPAL